MSQKERGCRHTEREMEMRRRRVSLFLSWNLTVVFIYIIYR